ncbi:MAG: N-formylglutamate amidohydrolase, partial [Candidatus Aenigmarchaeota archaeon]|nr:N-formylglutamate amidohydrolase [Candidatus Aenigmarchaeota archaeon]
MSDRFLLFQFLNQASRKIEDNPYLNFVSVIKNYKIFGNILSGTIHDFYRDRNKSYFVNFFTSKDLYKIVKSDIERVHGVNDDIKVTIFKEGFVIYDNYKTNQFNLFLLTCHSGTYITPSIEKKMLPTKEQRYSEEDIASDEIYSKLVLKQGGIWIDNKLSRYYCDVNRNISNCIYGKNNSLYIDTFWKKALTKAEEKKIHDVYRKFYFLLKNLLDTYKFNIILDGHTMK